MNGESKDKTFTTDANEVFPPYLSPTGLEGNTAMHDAITKLTIQPATNRKYTIPLYPSHGPVCPCPRCNSHSP